MLSSKNLIIESFIWKNLEKVSNSRKQPSNDSSKLKAEKMNSNNKNKTWQKENSTDQSFKPNLMLTKLNRTNKENSFRNLSTRWDKAKDWSVSIDRKIDPIRKHRENQANKNSWRPKILETKNRSKWLKSCKEYCSKNALKPKQLTKERRKIFKCFLLVSKNLGTLFLILGLNIWTRLIRNRGLFSSRLIWKVKKFSNKHTKSGSFWQAWRHSLTR